MEFNPWCPHGRRRESKAVSDLHGHTLAPHTHTKLNKWMDRQKLTHKLSVVMYVCYPSTVEAGRKKERGKSKDCEFAANQSYIARSYLKQTETKAELVRGFRQAKRGQVIVKLKEALQTITCFSLETFANYKCTFVVWLKVSMPWHLLPVGNLGINYNLLEAQ